LSFSRPRDLLDLAQLNKRLSTPVLLCLLGLAVLSNRVFVLRQFTARIDQNSSFHLPIHDAVPSHADKRTFLLAISNEGLSELQQLPRGAIGIEPDPEGALRDYRVLSKSKTDLSSRPPAYILQSALNL
jgi:hypothetical protein